MTAAVPAGPARRHLGRQRWARTLCAACGILTVIAVAAGGTAWVRGWRTHAMTTPSMGTAAPVGTLVVSRPVAIGALRVGQIIVFHPPGRAHTTFAHRIYALTAEPGGPGIRTKGDINGTPDQWVLHQGDLVGKAVATIPDAGYAIQLLPLLLLGAFVILLATSGLAAPVRGPARNAGGSLLVAALLLHFHPLERVDLIEQHVAHGRGVATVVPTGILPVEISAAGGSRAVAAPGQPAVVHLAHVPANGGFHIATTIHLSGWWWLTLAAWMIPMLVALRPVRQGIRMS